MPEDALKIVAPSHFATLDRGRVEVHQVPARMPEHHGTDSRDLIEGSGVDPAAVIEQQRVRAPGKQRALIVGATRYVRPQRIDDVCRCSAGGVYNPRRILTRKRAHIGPQRPEVALIDVGMAFHEARDQDPISEPVVDVVGPERRHCVLVADREDAAGAHCDMRRRGHGGVHGDDPSSPQHGHLRHAGSPM